MPASGGKGKQAGQSYWWQYILCMVSELGADERELEILHEGSVSAASPGPETDKPAASLAPRLAAEAEVSSSVHTAWVWSAYSAWLPALLCEV